MVSVHADKVVDVAGCALLDQLLYLCVFLLMRRIILFKEGMMTLTLMMMMWLTVMPETCGKAM